MAAARLQRWALILASYQYEIEFQPTDKHSNADGVSRLPLPHPPTLEENVSEVTLYNLQLLESLPITAEQINKASKNDTVLSKVNQYTLSGWPDRTETIRKTST